MTKATFRLDVARFLRETSRLGPTVVGAYITIMLDYFEQGEAPPDDDAVLARIVGCDLALWTDIRPKLIWLFDEAEIAKSGGRWVHDHVEAEIAAASKRVSRSKNAASAASASHQARANGASEPAVVVRKPTVLAENLGAEDDGDEAALNVRSHSELSDVVVGDDEDDIEGDLEPPMPKPVGVVFESGIDPEFQPSAAQLLEIMNDGYTSEQIAPVLDAFKRYNINMGTTSTNWPELWTRWWARKKPSLHPAERKPRPRVEVSRRAPPPPQTE